MPRSNANLKLHLLTLLLATTVGLSGCGSEPEDPGPAGGQGGSGGRGGAGAAGGTGGSRPGGTGGSGGAAATGGTGGTGGVDAGPNTTSDSGARDLSPDQLAQDTAVSGDGSAADGTAGGDGAPSATRPDAMGAACATGQRYAFTIRPFTSQRGTFTAFFTVTPSAAPTNSVIGLSDGQKYLHDDFAAIVRFGTSGNLDARNGAAYTSLTPIRYKVTDYHFRLVVNVPARTYDAYVSFEGNPEITIGTNLAFRDSAGMPTQLNYWGVEAIAPHMTRVCGFLVQ